MEIKVGNKGYMKVKEWFFNKTYETALGYGICLRGEYTDLEVDGEVIHDVMSQEIFRVDEILDITEKAVKVKIDAETMLGKYRPYTVWVPKSVIID